MFDLLSNFNILYMSTLLESQIIVKYFNVWYDYLRSGSYLFKLSEKL